MDEESLNSEAKKIEALVRGKSVSKVFRPRKNEICIVFDDGSRFFVDALGQDGLDFSITEGRDE